MEHKKTHMTILFDIDGTLIQAGRNIYDLPKLKKRIFYLAKSFSVGLCTARPVTDSLEVYKALNLNGPVIAENGACYQLMAGGKLHLAKGVDTKINHKVLNSLKNFCEEYGYRLIYSIKGNDQNIPAATVLLNKMRFFSSSIYVNHKTSNDLPSKIVAALTRSLSVYPETYQIDRISNTKIVIQIKSINKSRTAEIALGDQCIYLISDNEIAASTKILYLTHICGDEDYKARCDFVSDHAGLNGIIDCLDYIQDHHE